jgi:hypothetical protein
MAGPSPQSSSTNRCRQRRAGSRGNVSPGGILLLKILSCALDYGPTGSFRSGLDSEDAKGGKKTVFPLRVLRAFAVNLISDYELKSTGS